MLFLLVLTLTLYYLLPMGITAASSVSRKITAPLIESSQEGFEKVHQEFSPAQVNSRLFAEDADADDSIFSALDFTAKYEMTRERIRQIGEYFKDKTTLMATLTLQLVAGYLFDCIIFPLTFFVILYVLTRSLVTFLIRSVNYPRTHHKQSGVA
jgi:predicted PurR-regulated permease PerM